METGFVMLQQKAAAAACPSGRQKVWDAHFVQLSSTKAEACEPHGSQKLPRNLPLDAPPSCEIVLILGTTNISETSLSNSEVFMMLQKPGTLNPTNDSFQ